MTEQPLRIAIIGGGIGGLSFAVSLSKSDRDFILDIYEAKPTYSEFGAGVGMWPRVWEIMRNLGLEEDIKRKLGALPGGNKFQLRKSDQAEGFTFGESLAGFQTIHRGDLLKILADSIPSDYNTHFSKRLLSYTEEVAGPITLKFSDGTTATCDLLIGADGVKSSVRENVFNTLADNAKTNGSSQEKAEQLRRCTSASWTGQTIYRSIFPKEALIQSHPNHLSLSMPVEFLGKDRLVITYPISQGQTINAAAIVFSHQNAGTTHEGPWVMDVDHEELVRNFVGWEPEAQSILRLMGRSSRWLVNSVTVPTFVSGRAVLLGDAAHAMEPFLGSGAGQAIEDGFILSTLLAQEETTIHTLPLALQVYDGIRRPVAQEVQKRSTEAGRVASLNGKSMSTRRVEESTLGLLSLEAMKEVSQELDEISLWAWANAAMEEPKRAVAAFRQRLGLTE